MGDFKQRVGDITQILHNRQASPSLTSGPSTGSAILDAPDLLAIWLTNARLKLIFADGTSKIEIHKAGGTEWTTAQKHAGENVADMSLEFMAVQMK